MDKTRIFFFFSWGDFWDFREMQRLTCFETFYKGLAKEEGENQTDPASRSTKTKQTQYYRAQKAEQEEEEMF